MMSPPDHPYQRYTYSSMGRYKSRHQEQIADNTSNTLPQQRPYHGSYGSLLFDPRWKNKRKDILARDGYRCIICHSGEELLVHHRQYHYLTAVGKFKPPWDYDNQLMITICNTCHQKGHNSYEIPIINI